MSKPAAGNYYIVNSVTTTDGTSLAVNYSGANTALTVTELGSQPTQVWIITDYGDGKTQSISPQDAPSLQVAFGSGHDLTVVPADDYTWSIDEKDGIYTIKNARFRVFWGLRREVAGEAVTIGPRTEDAKQEWKLISA